MADRARTERGRRLRDTRTRLQREAAAKYRCPVPGCGWRAEDPRSVARHVGSKARYEKANAFVVGRFHWDWQRSHGDGPPQGN